MELRAHGMQVVYEGSGGVGVVYVGTPTDGDRLVAIGPFTQSTGEATDDVIYVGPPDNPDGQSCKSLNQIARSVRFYLVRLSRPPGRAANPRKHDLAVKKIRHTTLRLDVVPFVPPSYSYRPDGRGEWARLLLRFIRKIEVIPDGCWEWRGPINAKTGFGEFNAASRNVGAHRIAYRLFVGPVPDDMHVRHSCPRQHCVKPHHLYLSPKVGNPAWQH